MSIFSDQHASPIALGKGICPYLGLADDPQTCLTYPSEWNLCHHAKPVSVVRLEYQRNTCLLATHSDCPVFQSERKQPLPSGLRKRRTKLWSRKLALLLLLLVLTLGFILWMGWWRSSRISMDYALDVSLQTRQPGASQEAQPVGTVELIELSAATPIFSQTTPTPPVSTPAHSATSPSPLNCGYELEGRIESGQYTLILHRVARGESMDLLASKYKSSIEAIQALNYFLPSPLWRDLVVVIPAGSFAVGDLPVFEPFYVLEPVASLDALAGQLSVSKADLIKHNNLDASCQAYAGWFLIPRPARRNP